MSRFVPFDSIQARVAALVGAPGALPADIPRLYLVRDLYGKVRLSISDEVARSKEAHDGLESLATELSRALGAHGYPPEDTLLLVDQSLLTPLEGGGREIRPGVYWVDRLVTGGNWWTVRAPNETRGPDRFTLYSVKGGVGRTTTAAVLAWHLARNGDRVLVVDLDLESPGLSSAMLDARARPEFGLTDWFVEDLVGQGDRVLEEMTSSPSWVLDLEGEVHVAPAHGREPGEYLAKLGRVYIETPDPWPTRLERLMQCLEERCEPTLVLLESRSGLHDIAAATVTDLDAQVLLFATDSESTWQDYDVLFRHWHNHGLSTSIRERLSVVSALTPELYTDRYLEGFRERSWNLFRERLYDEVRADDDPTAERFAFDLEDEHAPHAPLPVLWNRGLAAGASLHHLEPTPVALAYAEFLRRFEALVEPRAV